MSGVDIVLNFNPLYDILGTNDFFYFRLKLTGELFSDYLLNGPYEVGGELI